MHHPISRTLQAASGAYAVYAWLRPDHLERSLGLASNTATMLGRTYAVRDLPLSIAGAMGGPSLLPVAVAGRVVSDLGDALVLTSTTTGASRRKAAAITLGWAALNAGGYLLDRWRACR